MPIWKLARKEFPERDFPWKTALSAYPVKELGGRILNLNDKRSEIFAAIDFLLSGF